MNIYGDSYGDLSRNVQSAANARQAALAQSLSTAVAALNEARNHQTELQKLSQAKDQFAQEMAWRKAQEAERSKDSDRTYQLAKDQAGLNAGYLTLAQKAEADRAAQLSPAKQREHDITFNQADSDAANGTFDNPDHVLKMYPTLSPAEAGVIFNRSQDARKQIVNDYTTANNAANVLNKHQDLTKRIYAIDDISNNLKTGKGTSLNPLNWSWVGGANSQADTTLDQLTQERQKAGRLMQQIEPVASALQKDKNVQNLVTFDPGTERYVPTVSAPRWMTSPLKTGGKPVSPQTPVNDNGNDAAPDEWSAGPSTQTSTAGGSGAPARTASTVVQGPQEATVKIRGRDGSIYNIPGSKVKIALTRGGSLLDTPTVVQPAPSGSALSAVESGFMH
jgi:hypothetical protein